MSQKGFRVPFCAITCASALELYVHPCASGYTCGGMLACVLASVYMYSCYYVSKAAGTPEKGVCVCMCVGGSSAKARYHKGRREWRMQL